MSICREKPPPLYQTAPHRATACYLYADAPVAASSKLNDIFVPLSQSPQITPNLAAAAPVNGANGASAERKTL